MKTNVVPMPSLASDYTIEEALVKGAGRKALMVELSSGVRSAVVALSCLVTPEPGDRVLVGRSANACWVLAVLERETSADVALRFPGSVRVSTPEGRIGLSAEEGIDLVSGGRSRWVSDEIDLHAARAGITAERVDARSGEIEAHARTVALFAKNIDTVADRVTQKAKNLIRWVEGLETLHIGDLVRNVRRSVLARSRQTIITAEKDVRLDGERIHMG